MVYARVVSWITRRWAWRAGRQLLSAVLALWLVVASGPALADRRTDARRAFRQAMDLLEAGRTLEAIRALERAYEILPHPDVLFNIGQLYAKAGRVEEAIDYLERYLASGPADADGVRDTVSALRARLAPTPIAVRSEVQSSSVTVDLGVLRRSRDLMESLALTTGSERIQAAADDLSALEDQLRKGVLPAAPSPPPVLAAPVVATASTPAIAPPRGSDIYDAKLVSASRFLQSPLDAPSATHIITREEIKASGLVHIGELLRRVPGADVMTNAPSDVNVSFRGFNQRLSNRVLVLVDGRSVYFDPLGTTFWHQLTVSVEDIERIEVIRGPASAIYGADAFAGVVNIITRLPGADEGSELVAGAGSHAWLHEHASNSGRSGALGYRFSASFDGANRFSQELADNRVDFARNFDDQANSWRMVRANGALSYRLAPELGLILRGGIAHGQSEWQAVSGLRDYGMDTEANAFASAQLDSSWGMARVFYSRIDASGGPQYVPLGANPYLFDIVSQIFDAEVMLSRAFDLGVRHNLQLGGSFRFKDVEWNYLDMPRQEKHFAAFLQDTLDITSWLKLQGSVRVDFHPLLESPPISPRGAIIVKPDEQSSFRLSAGTAFRTPSFLESYVNVGANFDIPALTGTTRGSEVAGRDLDPESIFSVELSYQNLGSDYFDVEVVGYYARVSDLAPVPAPDPNDLARLYELNANPRAELDPFLGVYTVGDALYRNEDAVYDAIGGELALRVYPAEGLDIYGNYAIEDISIANDVVGVNRFEDRTSTHKFNLGFRVRTDIGIDLSADAHFATSQVWSELLIGRTTNVAEIAPASYELPGYHLINARLGWRLFEDSVELGLAGFNITNNRHRQHPFGQLLGARVLGTLSLRL